MISSNKLKGLSLLLVTILMIGITLANLSTVDNFIYRHFGDELSHFVHLRLSYFHKSEANHPESNDFRFQVYSHNVRVDTRNRFPHEKSWRERKDSVVRTIQEYVQNAGGDDHIPSLVGLQEVKHHQINDILRGLNFGSSEEFPWKHYGVGRDDGDTLGEYTPILYNASEWTLINGTCKWLAENPNRPEKSWGSSTKRIITFTTFLNNDNGVYINFINTHLDHKSKYARRKASDLIVDWVTSMPNDYVTILTGDFNSFKDGIAYRNIASTMKDAYEVAISEGVERDIQDSITYTGFEESSQHTLIDFQWFKDTKSWTGQVESFKTVSNEEDSVKFSDHKPLIGIYEIKKAIPAKALTDNPVEE